LKLTLVAAEVTLVVEDPVTLTLVAVKTQAVVEVRLSELLFLYPQVELTLAKVTSPLQGYKEILDAN
jgi:hypothetical protein